jgi:hypothetical protein
VAIVPPLDEGDLPEEQRATLLCFVLVAPGSEHAFCSRYDFGPWPLLPAVSSLPPRVQQVRRPPPPDLQAGIAQPVLRAVWRGSRGLLTQQAPRCAVSAGAVEHVRAVCQRLCV